MSVPFHESKEGGGVCGYCGVSQPVSDLKHDTGCVRFASVQVVFVGGILHEQRGALQCHMYWPQEE